MSKKIFFRCTAYWKPSFGKLPGRNKNFVNLNNDKDNECIFCVVDLHAITVKQDPNELRNNIRETVATFLASGIDSNRSIIFNQSSVSAHAEGAWILSCVARMGWLNRMTQFKEKLAKIKKKQALVYFPTQFLWLLIFYFMIRHMFQLEMIRNNTLNYVEILHKSLITILG